MLADDKYHEIERYINNDMTEEERVTFEQSVKSNPQLAQILTVYQDMSVQLQGISGHLDFNQKLDKAAKTYQKTVSSSSNKGSLKYVWWIGFLILLISILVWWKFSPSEETLPPLPEGVPIASLWEDTERPTFDMLRGSNDLPQANQLLQKAFEAYEKQDYTTAITYTDSITANNALYSKAQLLNGVCHFELNDYAEAIKAYDTYLSDSNNPRDVALWYISLAHIKNGTLESAKTALQEIIQEEYNKAAEAESTLRQIEN